MSLRLAAVFVVVLGTQMASPTFESELWPEEGRPVFHARGRPISLHAAPDSMGQIIATLRQSRGDLLPFDSTRFRTIAPAIFVARVPLALRGRWFGAITYLSQSRYYRSRVDSLELTVAVGDTVQELQYRAEGRCLVRVARIVVEAQPCLRNQPTQWRRVQKGRQEWWIHLASSRHPKGWLRVDSATMVITRERG